MTRSHRGTVKSIKLLFNVGHALRVCLKIEESYNPEIRCVASRCRIILLRHAWKKASERKKKERGSPFLSGVSGFCPLLFTSDPGMILD